ncbi:hypothetical protein QBC34DRAFT_395530 [Podospora aff. communis PSN243]|uniref:Methyltransferase n=1 Tax=Podospora aff. communis PSN243 TaxID=3040156 RepID=A0AAV9GZN7_9PEZI|nr:hypothetical protein QBC34DRAFT_395530 [Podospora aff. communis PSN243]
MARRNQCIGSKPTFNPNIAITDEETLEKAMHALEDNDIDTAIRTYFHIPKADSYVYHAIASITLAQVQAMVRLGDKNDLHNWYDNCRNDQGEKLPPPNPSDLTAYTSIFLPSTSTSSALRAFTSNARKSSIRALSSSHLSSLFHLPPTSHPLPNKTKTTSVPPNPYLTFLLPTCHLLSWCGPTPLENLTRHNKSHPILPIYMHHFSCVCPSHDALTLLAKYAAGRRILDVGSGTGYWSFMLRQYGAECVPLDNGQSAWRTMWVDDTVEADVMTWLARKENCGGEDMMLLVVYPIVGGGIAGGAEGGFMRGLMKICKAELIAVVGTQNRNGYTAFRDMTVDEFVGREHRDWTKVVQLPLPSLPGKDDALFIFQRKDKVHLPGNKKD